MWYLFSTAGGMSFYKPPMAGLRSGAAESLGASEKHHPATTA